MKEQDLIENKGLRERCISRIEVLDKVGSLLLLPNTEYATVEQVAKYYEVTHQAIETIISRHRDELETDGFKTFRKNNVIQLLNGSIVSLGDTIGKTVVELCDGNRIEIPNRGLRLFPRRAILRMAFLLTESEVAQEIRKEVLFQSPNLYYTISNADLLRCKKYEKDMECFLKALFGDELVKTQVPCGKYKLDFVIDDTVHIELNEYGHSGYDKQKEDERKKYVFDHTDYWSYDFNPHKESKLELLHAIFKLYEHIGFPEAKENI